MLRSGQYENELIRSIEDIDISNIFQSLNPLRNGSNSVIELADSISKIGLLSPILVRITEAGKFEIVAGSRRFKACKSLGWKKIQCHIVELDDRGSFEASIIENIQRNTLNIIEEGLAFRKYVNEFGWGAASELAHKLSKSSSYVSKRIRLLQLPEDVIRLICDSEISVSTGEELLSLKERAKQSKIAAMAANNRISSKSLREIIKGEKPHLDDFEIFTYQSNTDNLEKSLKTIDKSIIALRIALNRLGTLIETIEDNWVLYEILMNHKNTLHSQVDLLIREKKKYVKRKHFFNLNLISDEKVPGKALRNNQLPQRVS
jgi:ParB family chromosome partitioning protein